MTYERLRLDEACLLITDGTHYTPKAQEQGRPFLTVKDMHQSGLDFENCSRISEEDFQDAMRNGCCPKAGDVLFSKDGTVGKVHPYTCEEDCAVLSSIAILRPRREILDQGYFAHFLRSNSFLEKALRNKTGSAIRRIILANLRSLKIPIPPLEKQRLIAAILDKANSVRSKCRQADALRLHLLTKLFISMFGDPRSNPINWPTLAFESFTSDYVGGASLAPEDFMDQGVPVLHKGAIKPGGKIETDSKKKVYVSLETAQAYRRSRAGPGMVAVTLRDLVPSGPFIGLMADLSTTETPEYLLAQGAYAFRLDTSKVLPRYIVALVNMPTFRLALRQNAVGSTQIHIRLPVFKSIEIPVPPIEKQQEFAKIIDNMSLMDTLNQRKVHLVDELTLALQTSAYCEEDT